ncbi:MAG TPA: hypothetical protein VGD00_07080 [Solirubrobacteraceae bacterium]
MTRRFTLTLAAGAALLALCGSAAGAQAALPSLNISITATGVAVGGATQSGAVNVITTAAKGLKEPTPILVRLHSGATVAEVEAQLTSKNSDPNSVGKVGDIVFDAEGVPGGTSEAQTTLSPGTYVALNIEGAPKGSTPHAVFTVTASPAPAALPAPAAVVKTIDFGFKGPRTLKTGSVVRFQNEGFLVHMDIAFPVKSHAAALKLAQALLKGRNKAAEKLVAGPPLAFHGPLSNGAMQQETLTARPGWYVQACFMGTQDGREHTRLGMERVIRIVK